MRNLAGKFKVIAILVFLILVSNLVSVPAFASESEFKFDSEKWDEFARAVELQKIEDRRDGISYIISGSLALIGGIAGVDISNDPAEKGIYSVFQTIGVASVGYGAYVWQIGGEERSIYQTLQSSKLSIESKNQFLRAFIAEKKARARRDRYIRAVTHGLIAGLNLYSASQQTQDGLKTTLYFIGGVNLLAAVSFSFEF